MRNNYKTLNGRIIKRVSSNYGKVDLYEGFTGIDASRMGRLNIVVMIGIGLIILSTLVSITLLLHFHVVSSQVVCNADNLCRVILY